jgi:hypothetical protein
LLKQVVEKKDKYQYGFYSNRDGIDDFEIRKNCVDNIKNHKTQVPDMIEKEIREYQKFNNCEGRIKNY